MKILISTIGSRGDVQPYINLAAVLRMYHDVTIATHPCWEKLILSHSITFAPIGPDVNIEAESARIRAGSRIWLAGMIKMFGFVQDVILQASSDLLVLIPKFDALIASHAHTGASEAELLGRKYLSVTLQPMFLFDKNHQPGLIARVIGLLINGLMIKPYNVVRKKLRLAPIRRYEDLVSPVLNLIPVSPLVIEPKPGWSDNNRMTGYWPVQEPPNWIPPAGMVRFLESGESPVVISLGAMAFDAVDESRTVNVLFDACRQNGLRVVIQGFSNTLKKMNPGPDIFHVDSIPHSWLFSRGRLIIHHGGFGTTASAFVSGRPAIVIPHAMDQFYFADLCVKNGCGLKLPSKKLDSKRLAERIMQILDNPVFRENAGIFAARLSEKDGIAEAIGLIKKHLVDIKK